MTALQQDATMPPAAELQEPTVLRGIWASVSAVIVKESRWRMRGRRAFVIVTLYVALLALLVFTVQRWGYDAARQQAAIVDMSASSELVPGWASATIGIGIFTAILVVQTLLTVLLAPALSSGAISSEREKQTLELLITTPASTLGMVVGKLVSSLAYVVLLTLASIPLTSIVFTFGGIAPEDVVRAYVLLFAVGYGVGAVGLFMSALVKRTGLSTALSYVIVFMLCIGSLIMHTYLMATSNRFDPFTPPRPPPEALLWLNPLVADIDLLCTAVPDSYGATCTYSGLITNRHLDAANPPRDLFWPRSAVAFVVLGTVLTLATTQLIAPSRRLRRHRPRADLDATQPASATLSRPAGSALAQPADPEDR